MNQIITRKTNCKKENEIKLKNKNVKDSANLKISKNKWRNS